MNRRTDVSVVREDICQSEGTTALVKSVLTANDSCMYTVCDAVGAEGERHARYRRQAFKSEPGSGLGLSLTFPHVT